MDQAGKLQLYNVNGAELACEVDAHRGAIWSLAVQPGGTTLLTASADKSIATWHPVEASDGSVTLSREAALDLEDDVLCARYTADAKYIAAATLDACVRVYFTDSMKLYLTLYGHKLPVLSVSASSDGAHQAKQHATTSVPNPFARSFSRLR